MEITVETLMEIIESWEERAVDMKEDRLTYFDMGNGYPEKKVLMVALDAGVEVMKLRFKRDFPEESMEGVVSFSLELKIERR